MTITKIGGGVIFGLLVLIVAASSTIAVQLSKREPNPAFQTGAPSPG